MDWNNLFGTDTFTYGFDRLTQDEFCTAILIMLGIICLCQICRLFHGKNTKDNTADTADILEKIDQRLEYIRDDINEIKTNSQLTDFFHK